MIIEHHFTAFCSISRQATQLAANSSFQGLLADTLMKVVVLLATEILSVQKEHYMQYSTNGFSGQYNNILSVENPLHKFVFCSKLN